MPAFGIIIRKKNAARGKSGGAFVVPVLAHGGSHAQRSSTP
jgi:hypothetical protein